MLKIRLKRVGRKKHPQYRVVVADARSPRDGRFVANLGYYQPLSKSEQIVIDFEGVNEWVTKGAQLTENMKHLLKKANKKTSN